jgi:hypothetical protein
MSGSGVNPNTQDNAASNAAATAAAAAATEIANKKLADDAVAAAKAAADKLTGNTSDNRKLSDSEAKALFGMWGISMVVPIVFGIIFAAGSAYLSYQRFGALGWAFLDFFFPQFYYPYYSFFIASQPLPSASIFSGGRRRKN